MTKLLGLAFIASTTLLTAACDGGDGDFAGAAAEVEGIYKISSYTRNEAACAPGGASILGSDRFAIASTEQALGLPMLMLSSCASVDDCRAKLVLIRTQQSFGSEFQFAATGVDGEALVARGAASGVLQDGKCIGGARLDTKLELTGGTLLRVEQKSIRADDHAPRDGICWTDQAAKSAEGNSCSAMEELRGELLEVL